MNKATQGNSPLESWHNKVSGILLVDESYFLLEEDFEESPEEKMKKISEQLKNYETLLKNGGLNVEQRQDALRNKFLELLNLGGLEEEEAEEEASEDSKAEAPESLGGNFTENENENEEDQQDSEVQVSGKEGENEEGTPDTTGDEEGDEEGENIGSLNVTGEDVIEDGESTYVRQTRRTYF